MEEVADKYKTLAAKMIYAHSTGESIEFNQMLNAGLAKLKERIIEEVNKAINHRELLTELFELPSEFRSISGAIYLLANVGQIQELLSPDHLKINQVLLMTGKAINGEPIYTKMGDLPRAIQSHLEKHDSNSFLKRLFLVSPPDKMRIKIGVSVDFDSYRKASRGRHQHDR